MDFWTNRFDKSKQAAGDRWRGFLAEAETAAIVRELFKKAGEGRERIIVIHAAWKRP
jgi:hypothetical protein